MLVQIIEDSIPLKVEIKRDRGEDGSISARAYKINRQLDRYETDSKRYYEKVYKRRGRIFHEGLFALVSYYEFWIEVYTRHGETEETIEAFLRFHSL